MKKPVDLARNMSDASQHEQLLSAYLDGQLNAEDQQRAEQLLADHPEYVEMVDQWREQRTRLRQFPKYQLDANFSDRVLKLVDASSTTWPTAENSTTPANRTRGGISPAAWRSAAAAILTLAGMMLLTMFISPTVMNSQSEALQASFADSEPREPSEAAPAQGNFDDPTSEMDSVSAGAVPEKDQLDVVRQDTKQQADQRDANAIQRQQAEGREQMRRAQVTRQLQSSFDHVVMIHMDGESMGQIEKALAVNQIRIQNNRLNPGLVAQGAGMSVQDAQQPVDQTADSGMQAVLVRCSPTQIKNALEGLGERAEVATLNVPPPMAFKSELQFAKSDSKNLLHPNSPADSSRIAAADAPAGMGASKKDSPVAQQAGGRKGPVASAGASPQDENASGFPEPPVVLANRNDSVARSLKFDPYRARRKSSKNKRSHTEDPIGGFFEESELATESVKENATTSEADEIAKIDQQFDLIGDPNEMRNYLLLIHTRPSTNYAKQIPAGLEADSSVEPAVPATEQPDK